MKRAQLLAGAKSICDYLGFPFQENNLRPGADRRKLLISWMRDGLPVMRVRGRLYARPGTLDAWMRRRELAAPKMPRRKRRN